MTNEEYKNLVANLRNTAKISQALTVILPHSEGDAYAELMNSAADAIEKLMEHDKWISVEEKSEEKSNGNV